MADSWKSMDLNNFIVDSSNSIHLYSNPNTDSDRMPLTKAKGQDDLLEKRVGETSTSEIPVTTEEKVHKKNDVKARSMLLMALPNKHLTTFNQYMDAKTLFAAIQTRFGGNEATKKTQKTLLKQCENISQEDLNLKFLRSLPSEWNTHVVVWRNKPDLDTMSFDDLYNNFKIVKQEVKGTASSSSSSSSQNMAFVSSPSSTNEVNTAYGVSTANTQVSPASTQVSTASTQVSTANLSDETVYAFLRDGFKVAVSIAEHENKKVFPENWRKITINGSDTAGYDKSKVECFNCHKLGHFARECRGPRNQDSRNRNQDSSRRTVNVKETSSKSMLAIDGVGSQIPDKSRKGLGFVSYNVVSPPPTGLFSPPNFDLSNSDLEEFQQPEFEGYGPKTSKNVCEDTSNKVRESPDAPMVEKLVSDDKLEKKTIFLTKIEFVRAKQQEKQVRKPVKYVEMYRSQGPRGNQRNLNNQKSQQLGSDFMMYNKSCFVCGSFDHVRANCTYHQRERAVSGNNYTRVNYNYSAKKTNPSAQRNMIPRVVLMKTGLRPLNTARPVNTAHPKTIVYSARSMEEPNEGKLLVKELLKLNSVLFTDNGCFVLSPDFKLADESQVLLKVPKKNNMYSVDRKNIIPKESLTCLVAKVTLNESMLWHRRLGHVNFKTINKLVKDYLVRGLPAKPSKDETSGILKSFITEIENIVDKKVKINICDNGTKFKNKVMSDFCEKKGIKREFSVARTLQQNGTRCKNGDDKVTLIPTPIFSVHNWALKKNQLEGPPFTDHILAIFIAKEPMAFQAPKPSSQIEKKDSKCKMPGAKT
ncbi:ribonuclease H-like domain-containing protein [Tanacetum coccineum]